MFTRKWHCWSSCHRFLAAWCLKLFVHRWYQSKMRLCQLKKWQICYLCTKSNYCIRKKAIFAYIGPLNCAIESNVYFFLHLRLALLLFNTFVSNFVRAERFKRHPVVRVLHKYIRMADRSYFYVHIIKANAGDARSAHEMQNWQVASRVTIRQQHHTQQQKHDTFRKKTFKPLQSHPFKCFAFRHLILLLVLFIYYVDFFFFRKFIFWS